jgi:16S rRNA (cytosine967-C5)-methyltransferase
LERLHPNLVAGVLEALETIFGKGYYADKVIERLLKANKKWGSRDRAFVAEHTYEMVRWWRLLWAIYGKEPTLKRKELWNLFAIYRIWQNRPLPDWDKFDQIRNFPVKESFDALPEEIGLRESYALWFSEFAYEQLGDLWPKIAADMNKPADVYLRVNTLKGSREQAQKILQTEDVETKIFEENSVGLKLGARLNTFRLKSFHEGWYEVQDAGSQFIGSFTQVEPGMRVIDACAGAGGKTLHLAAMMQNKGQIIAMDVENWKLSELKKRARRNGVSNIETRHIENAKVIKRLHETADRLLLDAPCSGSGVLRRNPDAKWKMQPEQIERVKITQAEILRNYSKMLKVGGKMVYATCSIFPDENERQVETFLQTEEGKNFKLEDHKTIHPGDYNTDGFYMARLVKLA